MVNIIFSSVLFLTASFFEVAGGYLVWQWLRGKKRLFIGILGALMLFIYGIVQTFQPAHFGRVYAAYGGIFIVSSIIWGATVDRKTPDRYEIIGAIITLIGVFVIFFTPR